MYFELAWRNIWRSPRRTMTIITAIVIGVWSMVFMGAFSRGMLINMLENGKSVLIGDIQIHHKNYRADPSINQSIPHPEKINSLLKNNLSEGAIFTGRIKVNAYVSNARHSTGAILVGIDPEKEKKISFIGKSVVRGKYLEPDDKRGILVGKALLDKFDTIIGKKLILVTRNRQGKVVSKAFKIRGVFKAQMESTEKSYLFITMQGAKNLLGMDNSISEISIVILKGENIDGVINMLKKNLDDKVYSVDSWENLLPMLEAYVRIFDEVMYIWYVVVFIAMGFGIVNTSLMAVFERVREFGLLRALGVKPWQTISSVLTESMFTLIVGIAAGNFLGYVSVFIMKSSGLNLAIFSKGAEFFGMSRIIYPVLKLSDVISVNSVIFFLGLVVSLYPAIRAAQITPVEAMRD